MKGIFYSVMVSLLIVPILALILFNSQTAESNVEINIRSSEIEYLTKSIEEDLDRFIEIAGKRALIAAVSKVITDGKGLDDAPSVLSELIENGTIDGEIAPLVDTNNLNVWKGNIKNIVEDAGFEFEFQNQEEIKIGHNDSFHVMFEINFFINVSESDAKMGIAKNITRGIPVSIEKIEDPLFPLNSFSRIIRVIEASNNSKKTEYLVSGANASGFASGYALVKNSADVRAGDCNINKILVTDTVSSILGIASSCGGVVSEGDLIIPPKIAGKAITGASGARGKIENNTKIYLDETTKKVWDLSNLTSDLNEGYYHNSTAGASFLDRLEGNTTLSPKYKYGLETFINLEEFLLAGVPVETTKSCLDHRYWNSIDGSSMRNGNYDPAFSLFKIDASYADDYGIDELIS